MYQQAYRLLAEQGPEHAQGLEAAQKAWLQYRDAWCDSQGLSIGTPMYSTCRLQLNAARVAELNDFYRQIQPN
ncbi:lysozyme inhibitor LprI family protein [Pseudomonas muyukensis]|uniref:lysozyme inhibitor LprI family protein n=1 Tax=Pseudomonas muyukensis TaxID=2842357 RepID=UPI001CECF789